MDNASGWLLRASQLPAALQMAVAGRYPDDLAEVRELTEQAWFALWPRRPQINADRAEALTNRPLSTEQIDHVIEVESRRGPLLGLLRHNTLDPDQQQRLLAKKKLASDVVEVMITRSWFDTALTQQASVHLTGVEKLRYLVDNAATLGPDALASSLASIDSWWGKDRSYAERSRLVDLLVNTQPGLLERIVSPDMAEALRTPLAGSHLILDLGVQWQLLGLDPVEPDTAASCNAPRFTQLALAWNPVAHDEVVEYLHAHGDDEARDGARRRQSASRPRVNVAYHEVEDAKQLRWIVQRSCTSNNRYSNGSGKARPFELVALTQNPNLDEDYTRMVAADLCSLVYDRRLRPFIIDALAKVAPDEAVTREIAPVVAFDPVPTPPPAPREHAPVELVERTRADQLRYSDSVCATAACLAVTEFGDDPDRFVMFLQMLDRHKGEFKTLLDTVKRM